MKRSLRELATAAMAASGVIVGLGALLAAARGPLPAIVGYLFFVSAVAAAGVAAGQLLGARPLVLALAFALAATGAAAGAYRIAGAAVLATDAANRAQRPLAKLAPIDPLAVRFASRVAAGASFIVALGAGATGAAIGVRRRSS